MYLFSILAIVLSSLCMFLFSEQGISHIAYYIDIPSAILIIVMCIPILLSAGLLGDFTHSFRLAYAKQTDATLLQFRRSIEAVRLTIGTLLCGGIFTFLFTLIIIICSLDDLSKLGPNLAVGILSLVYAFALVLILLPVQARLRTRMNEHMQE